MTDLPKEHKDAVGLAYYEALAATGPWERVNGTGTVISLLMTSIDAEKRNCKDGTITDKKTMKENIEADSLIEKQLIEWSLAMHEFSTPNDESQKYRAAWRCQGILGRIGILAYKYGTIPKGGFKILPASGGST